MAAASRPDDQQRREQRRRALLSSALELFATRGYLGTPIEDLCRHAHVSTKSFYGVYTSREDCYLDLLRETAAALTTTMAEAVTAEVFDDSGAAERRLVDALGHLMADDPRVAVVLFGKGSATTFAVEAQRRENRRRAAELLVVVWQHARPGAVIPDGASTGVVGGLFDVVADWVADEPDGSGSPDRDPQVLLARLQGFYAVVVAGLR